MVSVQQILKKYVNLSYSKLVSYAKCSLFSIYPVCREADGDSPVCSTIASIVLSSLNADGNVNDKEKQFIADVLDIDQGSVEALLELYTDGMKERVKQFSRTLSNEIKVEVARLVLCIGAADETLKKEEALFMLDLIE